MLDENIDGYSVERTGCDQYLWRRKFRSLVILIMIDSCPLHNLKYQKLRRLVAGVINLKVG